MTKRWVGCALVVLGLMTASRLASAAVTVTPSATVNAGSAAVGAGTTSAVHTLTSDAGNVMVSLVIDSACLYKSDFALPAGNINVNTTATFQVTYTGSAPRGLHSCVVSIRDSGNVQVGSFTVQGTTLAPVLTVTGTTAFGSVRELDGTTSPWTSSQTFTVTNTGDSGGGPLTVSAITFTIGDYTVTAGPAFSVNLNVGQAGAQWTVTFNPAMAGSRPATMNIASNDPAGTRMVSLTGTGTTAVIGVTDVSFGSVTSGTTASLTSALSNSGTGVLTATSATITQTSNPTWFSFGGTLGCTAGTTACTFTGAVAPANIPVRCSPPATATGTETATLMVTSDSDSGGDSMATLTCTSGRSNIQISAAPLDFMTQLVGTTSSPATAITIGNTGNTNLTFWMSKSSTVTADAGMFTATGPLGCGTSSVNLCVVPSGMMMTVNVTFSPSSMGTKNATLILDTNDPDAGDDPINIGLTGVGIAPVAGASPTSLLFGDVEVGKAHAGLIVTVTNNGTSTLTISNAALTAGTLDYLVTVGTTGAQTTMLGTGASVSWTLACAPSAQNSRPGTFRVTSNGLNTTILDIGLSCRGTRGFLTATPAGYDFMGVRINDAPTTTFTLTNTGNLDVTNIAYVLDAKLLGFTVTNMPTMLAAGGSQIVTVRFAPIAATDGCFVTNSGDCQINISGDWGTTPTKTLTAFTARGDGLNADYDTYPASPNPLDWGSIRFDEIGAPGLKTVEVINTGGSTLVIEDLRIALTGSTVMGELAVVSCSYNGVGVTCPRRNVNPALSTTYPLSGVNDKLLVTMRCDPNNRLGMVEGTLTVESDLGGATPDRTVPLRCTSITAGMMVNPGMLLDFGPTDLDAVPVSVTRSVTIQNTGAAVLSLGAGTPGGANLARFAITATPGAQVASGGTYTFDVTYTPLSERSPDSPDTASITWNVFGVHGAPTSLTIDIKGYGADRHIGVGATPVFPDTFKNPGDAAPIMPVTISNTGYAPLDVTAVMLDNEPIWTIQNPDPVIIPARSSHDFNIVFAPLMSGKAPTGHLVIMDNDNELGKAIVTVDLNGNGLDRNVAMGPRVIPLGFTGIGLPIRLSELAPDQLLDVTNSDTDNAFRIARIEVDSIIGADGSFEIVDLMGKSPNDLTIEPGGTHRFDVTFTPEEVGDFEAIATLYLDQDPSPQAQVTLKGRGLYVDARGGGGCSTGGGSSRGWLALVLAALVLGGGRRRRAAIAGAVLALCALGQARESAAQSSRNLDLDVFDPTPATRGSMFHVQGADVGADGTWAASALVTYANNALILDTSQNEDVPVKNRALLSLGGAYVFGGRFEAGAHVPIVLQSGDPAGDPTMRFGIDPASGAALADASLHIKARLGIAPALGGALHYGAGVTLTLPTATDGEFAGNDLPTARVLLLGSLSHKRLTSTLNVGAIVRDKTHFANITQGSGVAWGAGVSYRVIDQLWAGGEVFGELIPGGKTDAMGNDGMLNTIEGLAGAQYRPLHTMSLGAALGRGVTSGPGTPALRGIVTFTYSPSADTLKPIHAPRPAAPPRDDDGDGIRNTLDECPNDLEDKDMFKDDDGCPETDNDADGLADAADKCPLDAEDHDRFEDEDGCPDKDNDADGLADKKDKCPLAAEDKDGFQDQDGCPEADNDKDGIVDNADKCPNEAEVINGTTDDDGCADKGNSLVVLSPDRLELLEAVQFNGTKVAKGSANVLGQLGATLRAHPEIARVRLSVHVQPTRDAAADQKLSEARAKAVREWLVDYGVDSLRLQSSGFGGKQPLVPPTTKGAQQINDRVELVILERK